MMLTGEIIAEALRQAGMEVQYFPLKLDAPNRTPTTMGSVSLNKIAAALNAHLANESDDKAGPALVEAAQLLHASDSRGVAIYDDARVSDADDAVWVEAWVRVPKDLIPEEPEQDLQVILATKIGAGETDSEGGHCD